MVSGALSQQHLFIIILILLLYFKDFQKNNFEKIQKIGLLLNNQTYIFKPEDTLNISTVVLKELYPKFLDTLVPFKTTGNGTCMWNMVSICLIGNESLQKILRLLTVLAMLMMQKEFVLFITNHYVSKNTDYAEDYA
jgi:hypothetical protein